MNDKLSPWLFGIGLIILIIAPGFIAKYQDNVFNILFIIERFVDHVVGTGLLFSIIIFPLSLWRNKIMAKFTSMFFLILSLASLIVTLLLIAALFIGGFQIPYTLLNVAQGVNAIAQSHILVIFITTILIRVAIFIGSSFWSQKIKDRFTSSLVGK